jgi:L-malate glycosyltransferase
MAIHQVLVSASPGDAITSAAYELRSFLRELGPSEIYARYIDVSLHHDVLALSDFRARQSDRLTSDVIIFHMSIGEPMVTHFVASRPEKLIVMYHNVSPPERFLPFDPKYAGLLAAGRIELQSLADKALLAMTVSEYNAGELREAGFRNIAVVPLVVDAKRMHSIEPHTPTMNHFETHDGPMVLFVGQLLPHKRPEALIQAYHILVTYLIPEAMLVVVGTSRLADYSRYLTHLVNELNLNQAWLAGSVSAEQLVAFYRSASVFATASEHEGFCAPIVEAMGFDVPVIARSAAAIPEVAGNAAVLLPYDSGPELMAEAMAETIESSDLRKTLVERGRQRVAAFDPDVSRATMLAKIMEVVG